MITEKTIRKHRYFTTGAGDMWILRSVETCRLATFERINKVAEGPFSTMKIGRSFEFRI